MVNLENLKVEQELLTRLFSESAINLDEYNKEMARINYEIAKLMNESYISMQNIAPIDATGAIEACTRLQEKSLFDKVLDKIMKRR